MRFNFRKVASVLASAAMLGSTVGFAAAANYPSPFVSGGAASVAVVVGANAASIDNIAAVDVAASLQAELSKQTATGVGGGTSSTGESSNLASSATKMYLNSKLNDGRTSLGSTELPTILKDGKVLDDAGTEYTYKQSLTLGSRAVNYSTSGGDLNDPELVIEVGTTPANHLYQYVLTLNKNLNITHTDVQGNTLKILGKDYVIGSGSTTSGTDTLVLFGAGAEKTLNEGETATVSIEGKDYAVEVKSIEQTGSTNYVSVSVDGSTSRRITEGTSSKVGGLEVYAKTVHYLGKTGQVSYADLNIGSEKITLKQGSTAKEGSDETSIFGTEVDIDATADGLLSALKVNVSSIKATKDYIKVGESYVDPVFGGIKTQFVSVNPTLDSASRDVVKIDTDNSRNAKVTFTSALNDGVGEKTFHFAHDDNDADSGMRTVLTDTSNKTIHVVEGARAVINEYYVINAGDYGRIVRVTELPDGNLDSTSKIQVEDVVTGKNLFEGGLTVGTSGGASTNIDGNTYYFNVSNSSGTASNLSITWGAGSASNNVGTQKTVFPRIKLAKGGWIAIVKQGVRIESNSTYALPGIQTLADYEAGQVEWDGNASSGSGLIDIAGYAGNAFGNVNWSFDTIAGNNLAGNSSNSSADIIGIDINNDADLTSGEDCLFNATAENGAAILFVEEKKSAESGNANNGDAICVNVDTSGSTSPIETSVSTPTITNIASALTSLTSDSNLRRQVTRFGSFLEYDSTDNDRVTIKYPDDQMVADIVISSDSAEVSTTVSDTGIIELGSVGVLDSEVATVSSKNLIVIGGSCINTAAAKLLESETPICGADFTAKTGISSGQFLLEAFNSPYATGKTALLVAGYEGADTRKAATYLLTNKPSTAVGTMMKKQTATYADVV